jgi:hypothetical protein
MYFLDSACENSLLFRLLSLNPIDFRLSDVEQRRIARSNRPLLVINDDDERSNNARLDADTLLKYAVCEDVGFAFVVIDESDRLHSICSKFDGLLEAVDVW